MTTTSRKTVLTRKNEPDALALLGGDGSKRPDGQPNVLFPLEPVDAEDNLVTPQDSLRVLPLQLLLIPAQRRSVHTGVEHLDGQDVPQPGPRVADDAAGELGVDGHGVSEAHAPLLQLVERDAVHPLERKLSTTREVEVGEVAVEEDGGVGEQVLHEGQTGGELVDDEGAGPQRRELAGEGRDEQQVDVAQDGAENGEAAEDGDGDGPGGAHPHVEGPVPAFVEAVLRIAVVREDDDLVPPLLEADGRVDDQPLGAADAQVWVEEDYGTFLGGMARIFAGFS